MRVTIAIDLGIAFPPQFGKANFSLAEDGVNAMRGDLIVVVTDAASGISIQWLGTAQAVGR
jgi:hypothetical protein